MALAERHRTIIYQHFVEQIGEEAAEAMLSQFPARDLDEPVTKEFVRAEIAELRGEVRAEFANVRKEMGDLGNRLAVRVQVTVGVAAGLLTVVNVLTA
ncbi:MAG TPA: hypothetical protein VD926_08800 [Acidimicrobiales bacterium]|nr:hypothetical protein [Acidimicrobiales bacterium]